MPTREPHKRNIVSKEASRIARDSVFFEKVVPVLLIGMAVLTVVLILIAVGILVGIVKF